MDQGQVQPILNMCYAPLEGTERDRKISDPRLSRLLDLGVGVQEVLCYTPYS